MRMMDIRNDLNLKLCFDMEKMTKKYKLQLCEKLMLMYRTDLVVWEVGIKFEIG